MVFLKGKLFFKGSFFTIALYSYLNLLVQCTSNCVSLEYETCIFESNDFGVCTCNYGQKVVNNQVVCQGLNVIL